MCWKTCGEGVDIGTNGPTTFEYLDNVIVFIGRRNIFFIPQSFLQNIIPHSIIKQRFDTQFIHQRLKCYY